MSHSTCCTNGTVFFYNSDFSGEVTISNKGKDLIIEGSDLLELMDTILTDRAIATLEEKGVWGLMIGKKGWTYDQGPSV